MCTTRQDKKMNITQKQEARLLTSHKQDLLKAGERKEKEGRESGINMSTDQIHRFINNLIEHYCIALTLR